MAVLEVTQRWDGAPLPSTHHARFELRLGRDALHVELDAPWFGDPSPRAAKGSVERLWEYEVAELFLGGTGAPYLEIELGPSGHYLVLQLDTVRKVRQRGLRIDYRVLAQSAGSAGAPGRYLAEAQVPLEYLPAGVCRGNAFLIHGSGAARCYHAHAAVPGNAPDFHQPARFAAIAFDAR